MNSHIRRASIVYLVAAWLAGPTAVMAAVDNTDTLRLVPYPKQVRLTDGTFDLRQELVLAGADARQPAVTLVLQELQAAGLPAPTVVVREPADRFSLQSRRQVQDFPSRPFRPQATREDYQLEINANGATCRGNGPVGLLYAAQTLCQLIRANRQGPSLPCLVITDWPALRWRCFQDDLTRGPSSTLATLQRSISLGAYLKLNMFTYYMEYQYAFHKHPQIGPPDGSLTPADLRQLVLDAQRVQMEVLGNQQSFGHFERILRHEQFAQLRENGSVLCPVKEETYELLDDLYSEVCPLLPFTMFNVCCDETWGLGEGPSQELAAQIGPGGVYVQHIRRVHDLLKDKYGKRMMMWGDIILQHPDKLNQIPQDTVMLTWGYGPRESFEDQIQPFARSGYEFFVCPGISNWSRILPDFGVATTNIRNFVRDGAALGAIGMLNTDWEDDGEALQGYRWHGHAWGAECAWNASATPLEDFNRRIGGVLFGEPGDHFGRAIELLAQTHRLPGMQGMLNRRFWVNDFPPQSSSRTIEATTNRLLAVVQPAIEHLEACRRDATVNGDLLDAFLLGARRMEWIATRMRDGRQAAAWYAEACVAAPDAAVTRIDQVARLVRTNRDTLAALGDEFARLWRAECRPYALDWTLDRYAAQLRWYDDLLEKLATAREALSSGTPLPHPAAIGLALPEQFARRHRPHERATTPLTPAAPWLVSTATHRLGLSIRAGNASRRELPLELDVALPPALAAHPVRAWCTVPGESPQEILVQLDPTEVVDRTRLTLIVPGPIPAETTASILVYLGLDSAEPALPSAASTRTADGDMVWIENDRLRLLLGPKGAHVYRWEIKSRDGQDLTQPGQDGWSGFADTGGDHRSAVHHLECVRRGPALVQYRCTDATGFAKTIRCFGGTSWIEVTLNEPVTYYWDFDRTDNFAADGPAPGEYLFSGGQAGPVGRAADAVRAQVKLPDQQWVVKYRPDGLSLGLLAPESTGTFVVAPGAGGGGVGIEGPPPISHFVTYGGSSHEPPRQILEQLQATLDFRNQPFVTVHALQPVVGDGQ